MAVLLWCDEKRYLCDWYLTFVCWLMFPCESWSSLLIIWSWPYWEARCSAVHPSCRWRTAVSDQLSYLASPQSYGAPYYVFSYRLFLVVIPRVLCTYMSRNIYMHVHYSVGRDAKFISLTSNRQIHSHKCWSTLHTCMYISDKLINTLVWVHNLWYQCFTQP